MSNESTGSGVSMWLIPAVVRAVSFTFMLILDIWLNPRSEGPSAQTNDNVNSINQNESDIVISDNIDLFRW